MNKRFFDDGFTGLVEIQEVSTNTFITKPKDNLFIKAKLKEKKSKSKKKKISHHQYKYKVKNKEIVRVKVIEPWVYVKKYDF